MLFVKKSINPKEKARLKKQSDFAASLEPAEQDRYMRSLGLADALRMKRIKSAIGRKSIALFCGSNRYRYFPATGEIVWADTSVTHEAGTDATSRLANGYKRVRDSDGNYVSAARLVHEAVHGPIPEGHECYCINNDPGDLRITNLRTADDCGRGETRKVRMAELARMTPEERAWDRAEIRRMRMELKARRAEARRIPD